MQIVAMCDTTDNYVKFAIPDGFIPQRVWALSPAAFPADTEPDIPVTPLHLRTGVILDYAHDWSMRNGKVRCLARTFSVAHWILIDDRPWRVK